jgi:hypothetical protein
MFWRRSLLALGAALAALPAASSEPTAVTLDESPHAVDVKIGGRLFTTYRHTPDPARPLVAPGILETKPVLHPVLSPSGVPLTRAYPYESVAGEATDHPHHQGIYFTYDDVGPEMDDFWGNSKESLPAIRHVKIVRAQGGKGTGTLATLSRWVGKSGRDLLEEEREMIFRAIGASQSQIDFTIRLKALDREIAFGDTKEGMFAVRVAQWLTDKETGRYLSSEGGEGEKGVWGKRARWVRLQGEKDRKTLGIAILDHPTSTNAPTYWHARGYGCFSVNPLGQLDFQKAHQLADPKAFGLKLAPGASALFKYRVVVYEGDLAPAEIEDLYRQFAQ